MKKTRPATAGPNTISNADMISISISTFTDLRRLAAAVPTGTS
jgi:hypothetical protein